MDGFVPLKGPHGKRLYELARFLMDGLDPYEFAINASQFGVVIYPREHYQKPTPWETLEWQGHRPLPADWIGYLSAYFQPAHRCSENSSSTPSLLAKRLHREPILSKVEGDGSSRTRRFVPTQVSKYDGQSPEVEETTQDS